MKTLPGRWLPFGLLALSLIVPKIHAQPSGLGQVKAARVVGDVTVINVSDGVSRALAEGDVITQGHAVETAVDSSVILVFSNGSSVTLAADTRMAIDEFVQDPFAEEINIGALTAEPSSSSTKLNLAYGELIGNVKQLSPSSTYEVQTPVGVAGIRGTTFRIVYRPTGDGRAFVSVSTGSGLVNWTSQDIPALDLPENQEVVFDVSFDDAGEPVITQPPEARPISAETAQAIVNAVEEAARAEGVTVITPPPPPAPPPPTDEPPRETETPPEPPPAPPEPPPGPPEPAPRPPDLTPTAGR